MEVGVVYLAVARVLRRAKNGNPPEIEIERVPVLATLRGGLAVRRIDARQWDVLHRNSGALLSSWPTQREALAEAERLNAAGDWSKRRTVAAVKRDPVLRKLLRTVTRAG